MKTKFIIALIITVITGSLFGCGAKEEVKQAIPLPDTSGNQPQEFSPANITGMKLWFKADALPTIADSSHIAIWPDSSSNHFDAAQVTTNARPTYKTSVLNGKPVVHFNGTQFMKTTPGNATILSGQGTLIAVYATTTNAGVGFVAGIPYSETSTSWQAPWVGLQLGTSSAQGRFWLNIAGTNNEFRAGTTPLNTFQTQSLHFDGTTRSAYINGISVFSNNTATGAITYSGAPSFMLGMRSATAQGEFLYGDIAEVLYYSAALSLADLQKIETYLKAKYNHY